MLTLTRKRNETVRIAGVGTVTVTDVRDGRVHLTISCLPNTAVVLGPGQTYKIGDVTIVSVGNDSAARLGFVAPRHIAIQRGELARSGIR